MNDLTIKGNHNFMGAEIPVILGGFGEDKKSMCDKTIAEIHNMEVRNVRARITDNIKRFKENVDFIDLKNVAYEASNKSYAPDAQQLLEQLGYSQMQISKAEHIYLLSERGYAKLIKIMDSDLAWEIHDKLIDEYFQLRDNAKPKCVEDVLIESLQEMKSMRERLNTQDTKIDNVECKLEGIKEVVALNPNDWRKETSNLINKMALASGGYEHIRAIREESYKLLEQRYGVALNIRLTNKKKTMALNGVCKSKLDKLNPLDVIADDKKLIEGYVAIVKEMSIKYGVV